MYKHCTEQLKNGNHKLFYSTVASSTTDTRPPRKLSTDPNDWTIEDVVQYISEVDSTLGTHADAFRKHVNTVISFNICKYLNRHKACVSISLLFLLCSGEYIINWSFDKFK